MHVLAAAFGLLKEWQIIQRGSLSRHVGEEAFFAKFVPVAVR